MRNNSTKTILAVFTVLITAMIIFYGCGDDEETGIGPVKDVKVEPQINQDLANKGKQIFDVKCVACHKFDEKLVGPPLKGVTQRRKPEWIMNMILNPDQMTKENTIAKGLLGQYLIQMTFQNVTQDDARAIYEYFRTVDKQ
ncbi:MAG: cytochrome c [Ignavibacteria bacterium]|nr:cytochrome c [Ignavibacteria bacterium]